MTRWYRVLLVVRCILAAMVRGRATHVPQAPKKIIVVCSGKLGDIVCCTPVLRALRTHLPHATIVAAGAPVLRPLLADSGLVDEYLDADAPDAPARIRALGADAAVVLGPSYLPAAHLYLGGVPLVVAPRVTNGYSPFMTTPYRILLYLVATYPYAMGAYAPRERLRALEPLSIATHDATKVLGYSPTAQKKVRTLLPEGFLIGVSVSAGHAIKEWPPERFAAVIDHCAAQHGTVVLVGGPEDSKKIEATLAQVAHHDCVINTQGDLDIDELKALIARLDLFISVDTGPIYIAEAFGIPTIDITGPIDEREQPPRGALHRNVVPPGERVPQLFVLNARGYNREEALRQIESITVPLVTNEIDRLINDIHAPA